VAFLPRSDVNDRFQRQERGFHFSKMKEAAVDFGAGEGNRTLVISLEGCCSTIELHPHNPYFIGLSAIASAILS
jgi:hypothetical protein